MTVRQARSFCRICPGGCGVIVDIDDQRQLVLSVRPDRDDQHSGGYICAKGVMLPEAHNDASRLTHPLKRMPDGTFQPIPLEQALDEIAEKLRVLMDRYGPNSVATFRGSQNYFNILANRMVPDWLRAIGSRSAYSTVTIDQSSKTVTAGRLGYWEAGQQAFENSDVIMIVGGNPLVSLCVFGTPMANPVKGFRQARRRGMKLIIIDPRRTETARIADIFLQPRPGEDAAIAAGLLNIILTQGLEDKDFCARYVSDLDLLRAAVAPFTPDYVARRADVPAELLYAAAHAFAGAKRGCVFTATGPSMAPHSNLSQHLYEVLNVVCGRYNRAGDRIRNPGVLGARVPRIAQVIPPMRSWEKSHRSRFRDAGMLGNEMMSAVLPDEILTPGDGQVRALIVDGANPVNVIPDQIKTAKAMESLDLLVTIDPYMTNTAKLSHYILPPKTYFEREDTLPLEFETVLMPFPYQHYTPALGPPPNSEVEDDWYIFWALAKRLGVVIDFMGVPLDMEARPSNADLFAILTRNAQVSLAEVQKHPSGKIFDIPEQIVQAPDADNGARFDPAPEDIRREMDRVLAESWSVSAFSHRLTCRRMRDIMNTQYTALPTTRRRHPFNPAYFHPGDLKALSLKPGDKVDIVSDHGRVRVIAASDPDLRPGVVSMTHGWGPLPGGDAGYENGGSSTNLLISTERDYEPINAMPRMSAIPVNILPV